MFILQFISKFIKVLRAGEAPSLIAGGFTMGFIVGLSPFWTLQNVVILLIAILTKVNLSAVFFAVFLFSFIAYLFDPFFHSLGFFLLAKIKLLFPAWIFFYNLPVAPFTRFNNTLVMGSIAVAVLLAAPVYFLAKKGIVTYRENWGEKIERSKFMKAVKGNIIVKWYLKIRDMEV